MTLADTSIWIDHLRSADERLAKLLADGQVLMHPFVFGELACGNIRQRALLLGSLRELPLAKQASEDEVLYLVDRHKLCAKGIGWIDAHLLASAMLSHARLWTLDRRLQDAANEAKLPVRKVKAGAGPIVR